MIICGVKLSHDASIAIIKDSKLEFCYEVEKFNNNRRHPNFTITMEQVESLLNEKGFSVRQIDRFVFDGWHRERHHDFISEGLNFRLGEYGCRMNGNLLKENEFQVEALTNICKSYTHVSGHVMATYCTSPFSRQEEDSFILSWDGGMFPQLFYYSFGQNSIQNVAELFPLTCSIYNRFGLAFSKRSLFAADYMSIPGKMMAFAALGTVRAELRDQFITKVHSVGTSTMLTELASIDRNDAEFIAELKLSRMMDKYELHDIIASFQDALGYVLVESLKTIVGKFPKYKRNLCYGGGAALNISWNSAIRNSGIFENVWIPPFTNDSGSAIGAACCEMLKYSDDRALDWNVYSGQRLNGAHIRSDWEKCPASPQMLAAILKDSGEPIVFLNNAAELGPRALGNRSILAPAIDVAMKHHLNMIKDREFYRPVAPVCIEEDAPAIFSPGTPDPYMLFRHEVREDWKKKIPAVCHVDGTARLQTVNKNQNPKLYELLMEYKKLTGIPLLCNTSANHKGCGFFPDVKSATDWGRVNLVWGDGTLYFKTGYHRFMYNLSPQ